jgi:hypothetical protein
MKPAELLQLIRDRISEISGADVDAPWNAAQWREFSRSSNLLIGENWSVAPCDHSGTKFTASSGPHCTLCMRPVQESENGTGPGSR